VAFYRSASGQGSSDLGQSPDDQSWPLADRQV
jgi:hypothetical protein